jgi:solute:Na+ symporter, SSS family
VSGPGIVSSFSLLDGAIAVLSLLGTLWIGLRVKRYIGTIEDYLVANRGMGLYVGAASLLSTEVGIITYMYQAQFGFVAGFSAFVVGLITLAVCLVVGRTGFVITRLREMEILTVPEYFERRYGRGVRVLAGVLMAVGGSLNLGIFPIIEARFLAIVTGIPSRYLGWTMAALLLVALAYTAVGGMVSLIVTNYVQYVFLAAGTVIVTLVCLRETGWSGMVRAVEGHMGGHGFNPVEDLGLGFILWQILLWIALMTVWQSVAMRTFSTKDAAVGKKMFTLTGFLFLGRALIPMVWGIAALAFFWGRAEPAVAPAAATPAAQMEQLDARLGETFRRDLDEGRLERALPQVDLLERLAREEKVRHPEAARFEDSARDRRGEIGLLAMPWMLAATLPTGLLGLVVAGMLAASISTYAGYFLGWSSIIAQDIVAPLLSSRGAAVESGDEGSAGSRAGVGGSLGTGPTGVPRDDKARLRLTRLTVVGLTVFIMIWSLVYDLPGPAYFYLQVTANLFMAPTLIAVVGGLYWRRASATGAVLAFLLGAGASLAYLVPQLKVDVATAGNLSWALAVAGFVVGSFLVPPPVNSTLATGSAGPREARS